MTKNYNYEKAGGARLEKQLSRKESLLKSKNLKAKINKKPTAIIAKSLLTKT